VTTKAGPDNPTKVPEPRKKADGELNEYNSKKHKEKLKDLNCTELQSLLKNYLYQKGKGNGANRGLMDRRAGLLKPDLGYGHAEHLDQYYAQQQRAQDVIDKMDKDNCPPPEPSERRDAAKDPPTYKEWADANKSSFQSMREWAYDNRWAIAGGAVVVGAGALTWWAGGAGGLAAAGALGLGGAAAAYCVAPETRILTPRGEIAIAELQVGDSVFTLHEGAMLAVPIASQSRRPRRSGEMLVRLSFDDGRALTLTREHPLHDGRRADALVTGTLLGGRRVVRVAFIDDGAWLYDIVPASASAAYIAEGVALRSSAGRPSTRARDWGVAIACHP
jgi:hypothetical protein